MKESPTASSLEMTNIICGLLNFLAPTCIRKFKRQVLRHFLRLFIHSPHAFNCLFLVFMFIVLVSRHNYTCISYMLLFLFSLLF